MAPTKKTAPKKAPAKRVQKSKAQLNAEGKIKQEVAKLVAGRSQDDLEVTDASAWKGRRETAGTKVPLPSGNVCLARNPGIHVFIEQGMIPNNLLPVIQEALNEGKGISPKKVKEASADIDMLRDMVAMADAVVVYCVLKPEINAVPETEAQRDSDLFYVDEMDFDDKMFIFQWALGGTKALDRFREESSAAVVALDAGEDMDETAV